MDTPVIEAVHEEAAQMLKWSGIRGDVGVSVHCVDDDPRYRVSYWDEMGVVVEHAGKCSDVRQGVLVAMGFRLYDCPGCGESHPSASSLLPVLSMN